MERTDSKEKTKSAKSSNSSSHPLLDRGFLTPRSSADVDVIHPQSADWLDSRTGHPSAFGLFGFRRAFFAPNLPSVSSFTDLPSPVSNLQSPITDRAVSIRLVAISCQSVSQSRRVSESKIIGMIPLSEEASEGDWYTQHNTTRHRIAQHSAAQEKAASHVLTPPFISSQRSAESPLRIWKGLWNLLFFAAFGEAPTIDSLAIEAPSAPPPPAPVPRKLIDLRMAAAAPSPF